MGAGPIGPHTWSIRRRPKPPAAHLRPGSMTTPRPPTQLFFSEPAQRTALARERFFDEGQRPSGLVDEAVLQSWMRCCSARRQPREAVSFEPVSRSRMHSSLGRNRDLLQASNPELGHMEAALGGTDCRVLLTDDQGVIIHATPLAGRRHQPLLEAASRVGVNIAESHVGTNAPGIVARTGQACTVNGAEHFFDCLGAMHCAAAPIRDIHGRLAGVLDISVEGQAFPFDAAAVVASYAATIENRLLLLQSAEHLVLCFQASPSLLGTPLEALAGIDRAGHLVWLNAAARRLTGCGDPADRGVPAVFGATAEQLLSLSRERGARTWRLPNGLGVWIKSRAPLGDGVDFRHAVALAPAPATGVAHAGTPVPAPAAAQPATLLDHSQRLIETTLAEHDGNIARAARALGVSRGMLYRRLRREPHQDSPSSSRH
jgi:sigma-54 dependent transcriptional regulator, acetoin dehydrogenase operon transcriptional activator AcoR